LRSRDANSALLRCRPAMATELPGSVERREQAAEAHDDVALGLEKPGDAPCPLSPQSSLHDQIPGSPRTSPARVAPPPPTRPAPPLRPKGVRRAGATTGHAVAHPGSDHEPGASPGPTPRSLEDFSTGPQGSVRDPLGEEEPVTLARFEEFLAVERGLKRSCRTLPLTIAIWISFVVLIYHHCQACMTYQSARCVEEAVLGISLPAPGMSTRELRVGTIAERGEIYTWLQDGLVPLLGNGRIGQLQKLVGLVRVAQRRGVAEECEGLGKDLAHLFDGQCHPSGGNPRPYGPYDVDFAFRGRKEDPSLFDAWLEIGRGRNAVNERMWSLMENQWLDLDSQNVVVEAVFLNSEVSVYTHLTVSFFLHRGGWIEQEITVDPLRGDVYHHWFVIFLDLIWGVLMFGLMIQTAFQAYEEYKTGLISLYFRDMLSWLDWLSILFGVLLSVYFWQLTIQLKTFTNSILDVGEMPRYAVSQAPDFERVAMVLENDKYQQQVSDIFENFNTLSRSTVYHRLCAFWYSLIVVARFFRGFSGQPRIAVLLQTLMLYADFMLHYLVVFVITFASFAVGGYVLFGEQLGGWSTFGDAVASLFLVLFGHFSYEDFHSVAPVTAPFWFIAFFISTGLLLLGLLTAAVLYQYLDVRERLGEVGVGLFQQLCEAVRNILYSRTYEGVQKSVPQDKLLDLLFCNDGTDHVNVKRKKWIEREAKLHRLGRLRMDRRLRTRGDVAKVENDLPITTEFLVGRGCDPEIADRLIQRCTKQCQSIEEIATPTHRLMLLVARQMKVLRQEADVMRTRASKRVTWAARAVDRLDLKHAKCVALARRLRHSQQLPPGWSSQVDENGRRYLLQESTGLTAWNLPRHLL